MNRWVKLSGWLLIVSGVTHVVQIAFYHEFRTIIGVTLFGVIYFIIGLYLRIPQRWALWCGAIIPAIGGAGGTYRLFVVQPNPFSAFHVLIDLVVVPVCIVALAKGIGRQRPIKT